MKKSIIALYAIIILLVQTIFFTNSASARENLYDWSFKTGQRVLSSVHIDENYLYVGGFDSVFYALDLKGNLQWMYNSGFPIKCKALTSDSIVCFQSGNQLFGLNKTNGNLLWVHRPAEIVEKAPTIQLDSWDFKDASPIISNGVIYYCNEYGSVFGIDLYTGNEVFKFKTANGIAIRTKPIIQNQTIFFGDHDGYIYAVNLSDASLKWSVRTNNGTRPYPEFGGIFGDMVIDGENLSCGIRNSNFQVLNVNTGEPVWSYESGGTWLSGTPLNYDGAAFVGTSDSHEFISLNNQTGKLNWKRAVTFSVYNAPILIDDQVFVFTGDERYPVSIPGNGSIVIFDKTGKIINSVKIKGSVFNTPVYRDGKIYFASFDGNIYCISVDNLTTNASSMIRMDESDTDLGVIDKNSSVTKPLCYIKNEGNKADTLMFSLIINDFSPDAVTMNSKEYLISGNDSTQISVKIWPRNVENGNYQFMLKVESKSSPESIFEKRITFAKDVVTGIDEIDGKSKLVHVYPNPFKDVVNVEFETADRVNVGIKLFDMNGETVYYKKEDSCLRGKNSFQIETGHLPSQTYFFLLFSNEKPVGSGKLVKE